MHMVLSSSGLLPAPSKSQGEGIHKEEPFKNYTDASNFTYTDINEESTLNGY
jgi:hypothetical protein